MKKRILFISLVEMDDLSQPGIYTDFLRTLSKRNVFVEVIYPSERRSKSRVKDSNQHYSNINVHRINTLNIKRTNKIEKILGTFIFPIQIFLFLSAGMLAGRIDLIVYTTPPITLAPLIALIKMKFKSRSYLLLKDIFPQNAVDLGMIRRETMTYRYLKKMERKLYAVSDTIGCMSKANLEYVVHEYPYLKNKIEINPNSREILDHVNNLPEQNLQDYGIEVPKDRITILFGGSLGKPQGIDYFLRAIRNIDSTKFFVVVIGGGTEEWKISDFFEEFPSKGLFLKRVSRDVYERIVPLFDIGLIHLHPDFSIPNFPSRLLSYLLARLPVICAVDNSTDIGRIVEKYRAGYSYNSGNAKGLANCLNMYSRLRDHDIWQLKANCIELVRKEFNVESTVDIVLKTIDSNDTK